MVLGPRSIAFFDVDYTLMKGYSGYFTTRELIRRKLIKKRRLLLALLYRSIAGLFKQMNVRKMYEIALADMAGARQEDIMEIGRVIFLRDIQPRLYREGLEEMRRRKAQGHLVVILSSGPTMCIKNMEKFLEADLSFSNGPVITGGILQREVQEPLCYKEGKVHVAAQLASSYGTDLKDCAFYSDAISDLPLMERVGEPVAVNPDRHLAKEASARGWKVLRFEKTLGNQPLKP